MNEIIIPYHLVIPTILSIAGLIATFLFQKNFPHKLLWISIIIFLLVYLFIVGSSTFYDIYYQWDLNQYDLNKDGAFGESEQTKQQQIAMERFASDTSRSLSAFTGFIFATFISLTIYWASKFLFLLKDKVKR